MKKILSISVLLVFASTTIANSAEQFSLSSYLNKQVSKVEQKENEINAKLDIQTIELCAISPTKHSTRKVGSTNEKVFINYSGSPTRLQYVYNCFCCVQRFYWKNQSRYSSRCK